MLSELRTVGGKLNSHELVSYGHGNLLGKMKGGKVGVPPHKQRLVEHEIPSAVGVGWACFSRTRTAHLGGGEIGENIRHKI